jgi:hypothetical protein
MRHGAAARWPQRSRLGCTTQESGLDKNDPPEPFGVFKPVGHIVIAYRSPADLQAAAQKLAQGFAAADLVRYTPAEMIAQVDAQLPEASPLASLGQELNLIKAHRELAEAGCSFLVVHAPQDEQADRVAAVARSTNAVAAQRYGRFIVEELIDVPPAQSHRSSSRPSVAWTCVPAHRHTASRQAPSIVRADPHPHAPHNPASPCQGLHGNAQPCPVAGHGGDLGRVVAGGIGQRDTTQRRLLAVPSEQCPVDHLGLV